MLALTLIQLAILRVFYCQDLSYLNDIHTLSELPLERLLELRQSFGFDNSTNFENLSVFPNGPAALALQSNPSRGDHHEDYDKKGDKKGMQGFFQITVTALAFLAFGGYLLCLIVHAIKGKHMDQMTQMANMQMMAAIIRRQATRRPTSRPRRTKPSVNRKGNKKRPRRQTNWPDPNPEDMYYTLVTISEAYKNYHTVDYKNYNYTAKYYR